MKTIEFKDKLSHIEIIINLYGKFNIIDGDSGTGKTFLYELINNNKVKNTICINTDTLKAWELAGNVEDSFKNILKNSADTLIIIDRADEIFRTNENILNIICVDDSSNIFLMFTRTSIFVQDITTWHNVEYDKENSKLTVEPVFD